MNYLNKFESLLSYEGKSTIILTFPKSITNSYEGFKFLVWLHDAFKDIEDINLEIDFSKLYWFDSNLCSVLGAIFYDIIDRQNKIKSNRPFKHVNKIFERNNFFYNFGLAPKHDYDRSAVRYEFYTGSNGLSVQEYLDKYFAPKIESLKLLDDFQNLLFSCIDEIYQNARTHANSKCITVCGQQFPKSKKSILTITDLGNTIYDNVSKVKNLSPEECILWATQRGTTTKPSYSNGGLGLYTLKNFIKTNQGKLHIVSGAGYYSLISGKETSKNFEASFDGTIVTIEINLNDNHLYFPCDNDLDGKGFDSILLDFDDLFL